MVAPPFALGRCRSGLLVETTVLQRKCGQIASDAGKLPVAAHAFFTTLLKVFIPAL
jgi:hypothetical protein